MTVRKAGKAGEGRAAQARRGGRERRRARRVALMGLLVTFAAIAPAPMPPSAHAEGNLLAPVQKLIAGLDFDDARSMLAGASAVAPDDPRIALERARLAIYELDCDGAAAILARPEVQAVDREQVLGDIARGCQRVTAALVGQRDDDRGIDVRWQDENDAPLAPLLMDTVAAARDALTRDLGVDWPRPTRVVVVRDLLSLSAMTGLPYDNARTTGTVAVAKWGRVTLLSPRANRYGFPWRDTVAHELTHLAVTRATADRAPLWLQEGVAKRQEIRWRPPAPFDERPPPEVVAARGIEHGLGIPLDRLGPSIAMLPSADAAMVAFAEVTSFVRFYVDTAGDRALADLFASLKDGKDPNAALVAASGADLKAWDARWRASLESRAIGAVGAARAAGGAPEPAPDGGASGKKNVGAGAAPWQDPEFAGAAQGSARDLRDVRDRTRLAELLLARRYPEDASKELDRIGAVGKRVVAADARVRAIHGAALEAVGRLIEAEQVVGDPKSVSSSFGPWWALRGRLAQARGDEDSARASLAEAIAIAPFEPVAACETLDPSVEPGDAKKRALCDAARAYALPSFDGD
jgi:hypothetical protein